MPIMPNYKSVVGVISFDEYHLEAIKRYHRQNDKSVKEFFDVDNFTLDVQVCLDKIEKVCTTVNKGVYSPIDRLQMIIELINRIKCEE